MQKLQSLFNIFTNVNKNISYNHVLSEWSSIHSVFLHYTDRQYRPTGCEWHKYSFTSLSAQLWQYRDRRNIKIRSMPCCIEYILSVIYSAQYYIQHCTLQVFEQFGTLHMHSLDDKHPTRLRLEPSKYLCVSSHNRTEGAIGASPYRM